MDDSTLDAEQTYEAAIRLLPPEQSIALQHLRAHGRLPDLKHPKTFSEKIHRRKLLGKDPRYALLADKVRVKEYVREKLGDDWLIPTLFAAPALPPRHERTWATPFIIKANHASGWNAFVRRPPDDADWDEIERAVESWLTTSWAPYRYENFYNDIPRQILVEPLLGPPEGLPDIKCFVFNGRTEYLHVDLARHAEHTRVWYDREWRVQDFEQAYPRDTRTFRPPTHFKEMMAGAEALAVDFAFVRVDFYDFVDGPKFGEMTFTPAAGLRPFKPESADLLLGSLWPEPSI